MSNGMNRMNKGELLTFIDEVTFALDDLTLYLDTHPHCEKPWADTRPTRP